MTNQPLPPALLTALAPLREALARLQAATAQAREMAARAAAARREQPEPPWLAMYRRLETQL